MLNYFAPHAQLSLRAIIIHAPFSGYNVKLSNEITHEQFISNIQQVPRLYIIKEKYKMAGHDYLDDPKNPFFSLEDDIDDETFLSSAPPRSNVTNNNPYVNYEDNLDRQHQQLIERKKAFEERTIKSSERSISLLRDSEQIGAATAEVCTFNLLIR